MYAGCARQIDNNYYTQFLLQTIIRLVEVGEKIVSRSDLFFAGITLTNFCKKTEVIDEFFSLKTWFLPGILYFLLDGQSSLEI